jgi:type IV secretion system protein VirD4
MASFMATQLTAIKLGYSSKLGKPLIAFVHLYNPLDFWKWVYMFGDRSSYSHYFQAGWVCILSALLMIIVISWLINIYEYSKKNQPHSYGSAHFATFKEIVASGLWDCYTEPAVYVGAYQTTKSNKLHYLKDSSTTHVFAFAPSRSGKGVGLIIPTLLTYSSSVIISDFKLENWYLTSGFRRSMGHKVLKFDPTCLDGTGAKFNPLSEIRLGPNEMRDAQLIADMLVDPEGKGINDHWANAANSLLVSIILHVLYSEKDKSLAGVRAFLANPESTEEETLELMLESDNTFVQSGAREMLNKSEGERSSIISSALTFLKLYRDPIVADNTRGHNFAINDIVLHEQPVSLYLGIPPSDIWRLMPLMRLILQMILSRLTEKLDMDVNLKRRQLLLLLDEFPLFGRLQFFERTLGYSSGYNIRAYLISQDMQQIYKEYGREQSITSNCGIRIAYAPNTLETAKHLSEVLGSTTLKKTHVNYSGRRFEWLLSNVSISEHDIKRSLLTPDELLQLSQEVSLIFKNGVAPIYGRKIYYFQDRIFKERAEISHPIISDKLK